MPSEQAVYGGAPVRQLGPIANPLYLVPVHGLLNGYYACPVAQGAHTALPWGYVQTSNRLLFAVQDQPIQTAAPCANSWQIVNTVPLHLATESHQADPRNLIVNYIPSGMSDDDLRTLFSPCGIIESCRIIRDKQNMEHHRGYGFVKFTDIEAANRAIRELNGTAYLNKNPQLWIRRA